MNSDSQGAGSTAARQEPLRCRIWQNPAAQIVDKPHMTPYTVGVEWRDGMTREGSFSIDEVKLAELQASDPNVSRERLMMHMISVAIEQVFLSREQAKAAERASKLIVPERFR